jgi:DNA-binding protein YbaB
MTAMPQRDPHRSENNRQQSAHRAPPASEAKTQRDPHAAPPASEATTWLEEYRRRLAELGDRARRARAELDALTATASSASGAVTVTVNPAGALQRLSFGERADELTRPKLAEAVLDAARKAHAAAALGSAEALEPLIGDTEAGRFLAAQLPLAGRDEAP